MVDQACATIRTLIFSSRTGVSFARKSLLDREYEVFPVTMMVQGAYYPNISGSEDKVALFFHADDLKNSVNSWNGRPISLNHPTGNESVNNPSNFENQWLGYIFNARFVESEMKLVADMWLDVKRGEDISHRIRSGDNLDVSIGAYGDIINELGVSNGVDYSERMINFTGDHLAVLPDTVGACSWRDGCGVRARSFIGCELAESSYVLAIWDQTENEIRYRVKSPGLFEKDSFRTKNLSGITGVSIIVGKLKSKEGDGGMVTQSYRFNIKDGWDIEKAKDWIAKEKDKGEVSAELYALEESVLETYGMKVSTSVEAIRSSARTPSFSGTESTSWANVPKTFSEFLDGYYKHSGASKPKGSMNVSDASKEAKSWIASKTLLGDSGADSEKDILFFPVVNPNTNKLNAGALRAVLSGRGAQAKISSSSLESARDKAKGLLEREFGDKKKRIKEIEAQNMSENCCDKKFDLSEWIDKLPGDVRNSINAAVSVYGELYDEYVEKIISCKLTGLKKEDFDSKSKIPLPFMRKFAEAAEKIVDLQARVDFFVKDKECEMKMEKVQANDTNYGVRSAAAEEKKLDYAPFKDIDWIN